MSVSERLARIEEKQDDMAAKVTALFDLLNPLKDQVSRSKADIRWIKTLGGAAAMGLSAALGTLWKSKTG